MGENGCGTWTQLADRQQFGSYRLGHLRIQARPVDESRPRRKHLWLRRPRKAKYAEPVPDRDGKDFVASRRTFPLYVAVCLIAEVFP
jgi:hypothetical protein